MVPLNLNRVLVNYLSTDSVVTMHVVSRKHFFKIFNNFKAFASGLLVKNLQNVFHHFRSSRHVYYFVYRFSTSLILSITRRKQLLRQDFCMLTNKVSYIIEYQLIPTCVLVNHVYYQ